MPSFDILKSSPISDSVRCQQLQAIFDVPLREKESVRFCGKLNYDSIEWNVGLIVGPSGSGKTIISRELFEKENKLKWTAKSVIDDFKKELSIEAISNVCQAVGFNTITSWLRPYSVLSTGEKFRVEIARKLLESQNDIIVIDEFSSVVDRQVAQICSYATQRYVRKNKIKFVAVSCHYDIIEWLMPDWIYDTAKSKFISGRSLWRRPRLSGEIKRVEYSVWKLFSPYHYLTASLNKSAKCYALFVEKQIASFVGILHFPHPKTKNLKRISRIVTLPDWQGLGLAMILTETIGAALKTLGFRLRNYPAHPAYIHSLYRSNNWKIIQTARVRKYPHGRSIISGLMATEGKRSCAVFEYIGEAMKDREAAKRLVM